MNINEPRFTEPRLVRSDSEEAATVSYGNLKHYKFNENCRQADVKDRLLNKPRSFLLFHRY